MRVVTLDVEASLSGVAWQKLLLGVNFPMLNVSTKTILSLKWISEIQTTYILQILHLPAGIINHA
jgi:hypothetical protein